MIPITDRQVAKKTYYVTFSCGGKYHGCYARVQARNLDLARAEAIQRYGFANVGRVLTDDVKAKAYISLFRLKEVEEAV